MAASRFERRTDSDVRLFSTFIHSFAQGFCENSIDAKNQNIYLPRQIEPEAKT